MCVHCKRADNGGANVHELLMQRCNDRNQEDEQDTGVEWRGYGSLEKRERDWN